MKDVLIDQMNNQSATKSNAEYLRYVIDNLSKPMPYQWRVQSFNKNNTKCTCVAYIDARQAMDTLDKYCVYGWTKKSDAFKRAAVNFGVGRFLYDLDIVDLDAGSKDFNGKQYPFPADKNGNKIWDITEHINKMQGVVDGVHPLQEALQKLSGMSDKAKAIEWAKTLPDSVKTHQSFRQAFSKRF